MVHNEKNKVIDIFKSIKIILVEPVNKDFEN